MIKKILFTIVLVALTIGCTACAAMENNHIAIDDATNLDLGADIKSHEMYEFMVSYKYPALQETAFNFFKAYIQADIDTAKKLMDTPDNSYLEYFSTNKGSLDSVTGYSIELVKHEYYQKDGREVESARIDIRYSLSDRDRQVRYMCLSLDYIDMIDDNGDGYKMWKVTSFDFEA